MSAAAAAAKPEAAAAAAPAFAGFVAAHTAVAYRVAYLVLRDAFAAEEVAQDAFLRAWRQERWRRLDRPAAWLARVAWRLALDRRRVQSRATRTGPWIADAPSAAPGAERHFAAQEQLARLQALIAALPPALRHPLQLAGLREFENAEIAAILGISPAAVRRRLMRARQTLRAKLLKEEMVNEKPIHESRGPRLLPGGQNRRGKAAQLSARPRRAEEGRGSPKQGKRRGAQRRAGWAGANGAPGPARCASGTRGAAALGPAPINEGSNR